MPWETPNFAGNIAQMFAMGQQAAAQKRQNKLLELQMQQQQQQQAVAQAEQQYEMGNVAPLQQTAPWLFQQKEAARQEKAATLAKNKAIFDIRSRQGIPLEQGGLTPEQIVAQVNAIDPAAGMALAKDFAGLAPRPEQDPLAKARAYMNATPAERAAWDKMNKGQGISLSISQDGGAGITPRGVQAQGFEAEKYTDIVDAAKNLIKPGIESYIGPDASARAAQIEGSSKIKSVFGRIVGRENLGKLSKDDADFIRNRAAAQQRLRTLKDRAGKSISEDGSRTELGEMLSSISDDPTVEELQGMVSEIIPYASGEAAQALRIATERQVTKENLGMTPQQPPQAKPQGPSDADLLVALKNRMAASGKSADEILAAAKAMGLVQ